MEIRRFDYKQTVRDLLTPQTIKKIFRVYECKGVADLLSASNHEVLGKLAVSARAYNTGAANRLSGIHIRARRMRELLDRGAEPVGRDEQELLGFDRAYTYIHDNHTNIPRTVETILLLHRMLFEESDPENAGKWKSGIVKVDEHGRSVLDFTGVPPEDTPAFMEAAVDEYCRTYQSDCANPLFIFPMLILNILNIRPFDRGNRRISKLMALLALYNAGHGLGKYVSMSSILERTKESSDQAIKKSSIGWADGTNDYLPYCMYVFSVIEMACMEFQEQAIRFITQGVTKKDRIRMILEGQTGVITKADLQELCPDISTKTMERALNEFLNEGIIEKLREGRYSAYTYIGRNSVSTQIENKK